MSASIKGSSSAHVTNAARRTGPETVFHFKGLRGEPFLLEATKSKLLHVNGLRECGRYFTDLKRHHARDQVRTGKPVGHYFTILKWRRTPRAAGGTRGIGAAISTALKGAGYSVAATYGGNEEAAERFKEETGIPVYKWDVSDFESC